ncbi:formate dehydrogenase subunit gamma [Ferrimonas balearica]|nr:formate dehydrogenase subunit gamma [Ferrimonas balearica]MBW3165948.1 formate dehydrogenase subunit gamma [Ferrimonas balearica]MBY5981858.1 formate dehydrogenase subunit gamma [Ferrimonas balearica]MBY6108126.1 formate dehydrogenase subunit gamma [Ferrimonas balearica]MBY6225469.1 formate dehydrogenase subunit gamma [Ferrimonas balearica]
MIVPAQANDAKAEADAALVQSVMAAQAAEVEGTSPGKPELDPMWSAVKDGEVGTTNSTSRFHNNLINTYDPMLIQARAGWLSQVLALALFGMIVIFALFVLVNGAARLEKGYSGVEVLRWPKVDILVHWLMAIPCILLILTGLSLMAGRFVFGSFLGQEGVGALAAIAKPIHDYMAIPFSIFAVIAMLRWMKHNIPAAYDLKWFMVVGGYLNFGPFKGKHPDSGFSNAGEKLWFWSFTIFGLAIIGSGIVMLFPGQVDPSRTASLTAIFIHGISAIVLTGFTVVHIFMATVLSEGGFPAMTSGYVDENWAKQHHNVWYDEIKADGSIQYKQG